MKGEKVEQKVYFPISFALLSLLLEKSSTLEYSISQM